MYYYKIGYWTFDGSASIELMHEQSLGRQELEDLVHASVAELLAREPGSKEHFPFAWIYEEVANFLVARFGFKKVEYTADFEIYGSGSMLAGDENMPDLERLSRYLRNRGFGSEGHSEPPHKS